MDFNSLTRTQLGFLREELSERGMDLCLGEMCEGGKIKRLGDFVYNRHLCKQCHNMRNRSQYRKSLEKRWSRLEQGEMSQRPRCINCSHSNSAHLINGKSTSSDDSESTETGNGDAPRGNFFICHWCKRLETVAKSQKNISLWKEQREDCPHGVPCHGTLCNGKKQYASDFYIRKSNNKPYGHCKKCRAYESLQKRDKNSNVIKIHKLKQKECCSCKRKINAGTVQCFDLVKKTKDKLIKLQNFSRCHGDVRDQIARELQDTKMYCCYCSFDLFTELK